MNKMYEKFTDRARKIMALANQEAQRFNSEYIGTEHILLGLVKEGSGGVGANVLKNFDIDLRNVRLEVEKLVKYGPGTVTLGKLPQTPRSKKVIEYAIEEARALGNNYLGTEHLLLGLLKEKDGVAATVLTNLGLNLEEARKEVLFLLGTKEEKEATLLNEFHKEIIRNIVLLTIQKEEAIKNADHDTATKLRDKAESLRKELEFQLGDSDSINRAINEARKTSDTGCGWDAADSAKTDYSHILARIDTANTNVRNLLSVVAHESDISVIEYLTQTVNNLIDLREYYTRLENHADTDA